MRDHAAAAESKAVSLRIDFPLPGADTIAAAWSEPAPEGVAPECPEKARTISAAMLFLGAALLWFVPVGGALLLVSGGLGLAIWWEAPLGGPSSARSIVSDATPITPGP
jgi:hypothetical protein